LICDWKKQRALLLVQSEIKNRKSKILSSLTLFMLGVCADHSHDTFAVDDLAVITHFFD